MSIIAQNLTFTYNKKSPFEKKALDDITVTINDGEFVAIVGHTGSGKTTFPNTSMRLFDFNREI